MAARWRSLAWKIGAANIGLAVFAVLMVVGLEYRKDRRLLEARIRRDLIQGVATGALLLDGAEAEALVGESVSTDKDELGRRLRVMQSANPAVARLYLVERGPNGALRRLERRGVPALITLTPAATLSLQAALDQGVPVSTGVYEDAEGQWLSAFHPLRDRRGKVVAALGADFRASDLKVQARAKLESTLVSGSVATLAAVLLSLFIARSVTKPLKLVAQSTSEIAFGNLNVCLHMPRRDEIGELANAFNQMVERLAAEAETRERLHEQVLEKQRLEQELRLAAAIQQSFLPVSFPWSPRYRTNARTVLAELVGGDFYDFLDLAPERVGIVIGDVAGRGIAAAVYLARLISDFRTVAMRTESPREALERLNQQLLAHTTHGMFVTMTYLVLNTSSGEVRYSSAGHLPALRCRGRTGSVDVLRENDGLPLGIAARPGLEERRVRLEAHDTLLLVTDGVIEGFDRHDVGSALSKLLDVLQQQNSHDDRVVDAVFDAVAKLAVDQRPADDMTALSLSWIAERPADSSG